MKFTATDKWTAYARGAAKTLQWRAYIRTTASLSTALGTGTWSEITDRLVDIPDVTTRIEYNVGQYSADSLQLEGTGIEFFTALFNTTDHLEFKLLMVLGQSGDDATDVCCEFSGFIRPPIEYTELEDRVKFSVFTVEEVAGGMAAEAITTQYIHPDVDGAATQGLILNKIRGMYVTDANLSGKALRVGSHSITYDYNGGIRQARLDEGAWVTLADGANTLGNGAGGSSTDTQRLAVYVPDVGVIPSQSSTTAEEVVVVAQGDTLPRQWYRFISVKSLLTKIYGELGITSLAFDAMTMPTALGGNKLSFMEVPPDDDTYAAGERYAMTTDGTDLWMAIGHRIWKRTMSTGAYTNETEIGVGDVVTRLIYNARNGHLWLVYFKGAESGTLKLRRYVIGTDTLSAEIDIGSGGWSSIELIDENGCGTWEYALVYATSSHTIARIDGGTLAASTLFSQATLGFTGVYGPLDTQFAYVKSGYRFRFGVNNLGSIRYHEVYRHQSTGTWAITGLVHEFLPFPENSIGTDVGIYHPSEDVIYTYYQRPMVLGGWHILVKLPLTGSPYTTIFSVFEVSDAPMIMDLFYDATTTSVWYTRRNPGFLYAASGGAATVQYEGSGNAFTKYRVLTRIGTEIYGVDTSNRLWQFGTTLAMYVPEAIFKGDSIRDALNETLQAFMLVGIVSMAKSAIVYRRGDDTGDPVDSGHELALTVKEASQLVQVSGHSPAVDYVEVTNGVITKSFDGTTWDAVALANVKTLRLSNDLIPDELVEDVCYFAYLFFSTARDLHRVTAGKVPLFQFEPLDRGTITFTTTKIQKTGSGPIYASRHTKMGDLEVEILL
jgi:hypothetical protein